MPHQSARMFLASPLRLFRSLCVGGMVLVMLSSANAETPTAPAITNLPTALTLDYGTQLYLNPSITGTEPITYQWTQDGFPLRSIDELGHLVRPNTSWWFRSQVTENDAGEYILTATNEAGSTSSTPVTVKVNPAIAPVIGVQSNSQSIRYGEGLALSVIGVGSPPLIYLWKKNGVDISESSPGYLYQAYATAADAGTYTVTVMNSAGSATSTPIVITINPAFTPVILMPDAVDLATGESLDISATDLTGTKPMTFQWQKDGATLPDGTAQNYSKSNAVASDSGRYTLTATNFVGSVTSAAITVNVGGPVAPIITEQPTSLSIKQGITADFNVSVRGTPGITYQWCHDGQPIPDATSSILTLADVQPINTGSYTVVLTNYVGSTTSNPATLSIGAPMGVLAASAGWGFNVFIKADGTLWGMGDNSSGELGDGTTTSRSNPIQIASEVVSVSAGYEHTLFLKADGTLWGMGGNTYAELGDGTTTKRTRPIRIATGVVSASAGTFCSLFIKADGSLWATGLNSGGELGDGTTLMHSSPIQISTGVVSVSAGFYHSLFVRNDGTLWGMGNNIGGALGDGTNISRASPTNISNGVVLARAGDGHSLFIKSDKTLWSMGNNDYGQLGDGTTVSRTSPVSISNDVRSAVAGALQTLFIKSDDTLWYMGSNSINLNGFGPNYVTNSPVQIDVGVASATASYNNSLYVRSDGSLYSLPIIGGGYRNPPIEIASGPVAIPAAPVTLVATDGTLDQIVRLSWHPTIGATGYEVWRHTTNDSASATRIATAVPISLYYDLTAAPTTTYYYWVKATNPAGASDLSSADSGFAAISPGITLQPTRQAVAAGGSVTFTAAASGFPTPTCQWMKNGATIAGATGTSYSIASVKPDDVGSYTIVATNAAGVAVSNVATLYLGVPMPAGFDANSYLARYPDVAAVFGSDLHGAWLHYLNVGIYDGEVFDELFRVEEYLALYPELFAVFGDDLGGALLHWLNTGSIEGRLGRIPLVFSAQGYFERNHDVAVAANNDPLLAWSHYWSYGIYEGRTYDDELNVFEYLAINANLTATFVNDWRGAALHWMRYGRTEGRLGRVPLIFNVTEYLNRSPDVAAVWGTYPTTVFLHYWSYGIDEGRTFDDLFRPADYLALNPDLALVFGTDRRGALKHWVRYGITEGRRGRNP